MTNGLFGAALGISICLTTLNSLTKIGILSSLGGAVLTHPLWVQEVPVSIPGSGRFLCLIFNQVFNENLVIVMLKSAAGGSGGRACVNFWFPLNNFSLLWPIDTKLAVWVAYIKKQLGIAT